MGKGREGRKTRLEKSGGGTGGFIGFAAFADSSTTQDESHTGSGSVNGQQDNVDERVRSNQKKSKKVLQWSPIYVGHDSHLTLVFQHLVRQRRSKPSTTTTSSSSNIQSSFVTKVKALAELTAYFQSVQVARHDKILALSHYLWLYVSQFAFSDSSTVRASAIQALLAGQFACPKAFTSLMLNSTSSGHVQYPTGYLLGLVYTHAFADASAEVQQSVKTIFGESTPSSNNNNNTLFSLQTFWSPNNDTNPAIDLNQAVWSYAGQILSYRKPRQMYQALFNANSSTSNATSQDQQEIMLERYDRIMGMALHSLEHWIQQKKSTQTTSDTSSSSLDDQVLWHTLTSSKPALRFKTYRLWMAMSSNSPARVYCDDQHNAFWAKKIPKVFQQEHDISNLAVLMEAVVVYLHHFPKQQQEQPPARLGSDWIEPLCQFVLKRLLNTGATTATTTMNWAPTLLPLLVSLVNHAQTSQDKIQIIHQFISTLHNGCQTMVDTTTAGPALWAIAAAMVECCTFFLLKPLLEQQDHNGAEQADKVDEDATETDIVPCTYLQKCASAWLCALEIYLSISPDKEGEVMDDGIPGMSNINFQNQQTPFAWLNKSVVTSLTRFNQACIDPENNQTDDNHPAIYSIRDWFWKEASPPIWMKQGQRQEQFVRLFDQRSPQNKDALCIVRTPHLSQIVSQMFHSALQTFQSSSGSYPTKESDYSFLLTCLEYVGPPIFEETETSLSRFLMNDVVRWMVIHCHDDAANFASLALLDFDLLRICLDPSFISSSSSSAGLAHKQQSLWESILQELIASNANLVVLSRGLQRLVQSTDNYQNQYKLVEVIKSKLLEQLCLDLMDSTSAWYKKNVVSFRDLVAILSTCVGLPQKTRTETFTAPLVGTRVISKMIELVVKGDEENDDIVDAVLKILLQFQTKSNEKKVPSRYNIGEDDVISILLQAWRRNGKQKPQQSKIWQDLAIQALQQDSKLQSTFVHKARAEIVQSLEELIVQLPSDAKIGPIERDSAVSKCNEWTCKTIRWLELHSSGCTTSQPIQNVETEQQQQQQQPLYIDLMNETKLWELSSLSSTLLAVDAITTSQILYKCLASLMRQLDFDSPGRKILLGQGLNVDFLTKSLLGVSSPHTRVLTGDDRACSQLLSYLIEIDGKGGEETHPLISECIENVMDAIEASQEDQSPSTSQLRKTVSVLSYLLERSLPDYYSVVEKMDESKDEINAEHIKAGDILWYIPTSADSQTVSATSTMRVQVKVLKVHTDDFPRLYFTIQLNGEETTQTPQEKQTVADRLRRFSRPPETVLHGIPKKELELREHIVARLAKFIRAHLAPSDNGNNRGKILSCAKVVGDVFNIAVGQCGIFGKDGIGTLKYEIFQMLQSRHEHATALIKDANLVKGTESLDILSAALGVGVGSFAIPLNTSWAYNFDPSASLLALLDCREKIISSGPSVRQSSIKWITISLPLIPENEDELYRDVVELCFTVLSSILSSAGSEEWQMTLCCRSVQRLYSVLAKRNAMPSEDLESNLLSEFVCAISTKIKASQSCISWYLFDGDRVGKLPWFDHVESALSTIGKKSKALLGSAARERAAELSLGLGSIQFRWFALRLLYLAASGDTPIFTEEDELDVFQGTLPRLDGWKKGLIDEEAEELEDDVLIVEEWWPETLMTELESWTEDDEFFEALEDAHFEDDRENEAAPIQRMLLWLCFLRTSESAATADPRNRISFAAYAHYSGAAQFILNTAIMFAPIDPNMNTETGAQHCTIDDFLKDENMIDLTSVSGLVLSKTIEIFPTLSKKWWEEDCPKSLSRPVSHFVKIRVGPESFRRELERIDNAKRKLGGMSISGSPASRVVIATYAQDECTLSIMVTVPDNFPLRNVEVDGRKTHGVPEKRWKRWALQIRAMLNNQDGTLLDALLLWKENVDKEFDGVEPCPVCFSVLSVKQHELPNLKCKTCGNCFHSSCLYTWFQSSGKSQCVLCQQPWSGTRI